MPDRQTPRRPGSWGSAGLREAGPYLGLGLQLAVVMALFAFGGLALDRRLGTTPWLLVAGAVVGMAAMFAQILRVSRTLGKGRASAPRRGGEIRADVPAGSGPASTAPVGAASTPVHLDADSAVDLSELEREFLAAGELRDGMLVLPAWDAVELVEAARKAYVPVLAVHTYVLTPSGLRPVDALDLSRQDRPAEAWDEAARFIDALQGSELRFRVVLGARV